MLEVKDLRVEFENTRGRVQALRGIDLEVKAGEVLGIVGESGSGKSVTCLAILRLLKAGGRIAGGEVRFEGQDLTQLREAALSDLRGNGIGVVFQDPMSALNPTMTIGQQIMEAILRHKPVSRAEARARAVALLEMVRIPSPEARMDSYPHAFSGGMRQRAMIAMALACSPKLLIADEPTTALDVTVQRQILALLKELQTRLEMGVILITHDLGVIAETADRVLVVYGGQVMEDAGVEALFARPLHPYTAGLMASIPKGAGRLRPIPGAPPDMRAPPPGCPFAPRCPEARQICLTPPPMVRRAGRKTRCWLADPSAPPNPYQEI